MKGNAQRYLDLISQHLQEHHAAVLVGSGFSRNAVKIGDDVPDSPLWDDLSKIFQQKLKFTTKTAQEMNEADPLILAEHVELAYGRPELDRLLLSSIRDSDYQPSQLHRRLLQLPWSDIFTTNYDTLLERASDELTEKTFSCIVNKNDLLGSSGTTRIIKLHGSFPSQHPFIITAEDYRTYPQKFAPFVNTVQQSLLENTFCMIGFSGNDPNFNNWIGWIRDNLGAENAPNLYLLLHFPPSDTWREWLRRRNIIPINLSEIFPETSVSAIYEKALDYLWEQYCILQETQQKWTLKAPVDFQSPRPLSVKDALPILKQNRETYPGLLTLPGEKIAHLRNTVISPASRTLMIHCTQGNPETENEIAYLYEYDWLRGKALLPLFGSDLKCYQEILDRHKEDHSTYKLSVCLSILRTLREYGDWKEWEGLHQKLLAEISYLTQEQLHQLRWEECLCSLSRYEFPRLRQQLEGWDVPANMPLWALRKAGLWAEYGDCEHAHSLLQKAILNVRKRLSHQLKPDRRLLSLESAMMHLQSFISQASQNSTQMDAEEDGKQKDNEFINEQHRSRHKQYNVSWEEQNAYFVPHLEAAWQPFYNDRASSTFDFGKTRTTTVLGDDIERILAFSFLRFREETGIPFLIHNVYSDKRAAHGAAERIALYTPQLAILTLVRTDEPKEVENTITRGVLSSWTQEDADENGQFYLDALLRTEDELTESDWFYRNSFARLAADVLPEVLSELCSKCSVPVLDKFLNLLDHLYRSPKRLCYQKIVSLAKRLIPAYPASVYKKLIVQLAGFPLPEDGDDSVFDFPDPIQFVPSFLDNNIQDAQTALPEIQTILTIPFSDNSRKAVANRLLHCFYHGLLTAPQKKLLGDLLWKNHELQVPSNWLCTVCLAFESPHGIDVPKYLSNRITEEIKGYTGNGIRPQNDEAILHELTFFSHRSADSFSPQQISVILAAFLQRVASLSGNFARSGDFMGIKQCTASQMYSISRALWVLSVCKKNWVPTQEDRQAMSDILDICEKVHINHYGLKSIWAAPLERPLPSERELERCLRSVNDLCSFHGHNVLATAICNRKQPFLCTTEVCAGVMVIAQQIAWCIPGQLVTSLQTAKVAAQYQPDLLGDNILELIQTGLSQLLEQTIITPDDTVESASKKGSIRKEAAALAWALHQSNIRMEHPEVIDEWLKAIQNKDEFSEIRTIRS